LCAGRSSKFESYPTQMLGGPRPISSFKGDLDAKLVDFFDSWNQELHAQLAAKNNELCERFMTEHGRTRFETWFKLTTSQADKVCADVGVGSGWRQTIEEMCGFSFTAPAAPQSAQLVSGAGADGHAPSSKSFRTRTAGALLAQNGLLMSERLPQACFDVVTTADPLANTITEADISSFTDAVLQHAAARHGTWSLGRCLLRVYGAQAAARLPNLPKYGKLPGCEREWWKILELKAHNRQYVRPAQLNLPLASNLCALRTRAHG